MVAGLLVKISTCSHTLLVGLCKRRCDFCVVHKHCCACGGIGVWRDVVAVVWLRCVTTVSCFSNVSMRARLERWTICHPKVSHTVTLILSQSHTPPTSCHPAPCPQTQKTHLHLEKQLPPAQPRNRKAVRLAQKKVRTHKQCTKHAGVSACISPLAHAHTLCVEHVCRAQTASRWPLEAHAATASCCCCPRCDHQLSHHVCVCLGVMQSRMQNPHQEVKTRCQSSCPCPAACLWPHSPWRQ